MNSSKIRIIFIVLLPFALNHRLKAQNYKEYMYNVNMAGYYSDSNLDSNIYYYKKAFKAVARPISDDLLFCAVSYAKSGHKKELLRCFKELRKRGYSSEKIFEIDYDSVFYKYTESNEWKKIEQTIKPEIDYDLAIELSEYLGADQFVRDRWQDSILRCHLHETDSITTENMLEIIKEQGFPGDIKLGCYSAKSLILTIHIISDYGNKETWNTFWQPLLLNEAERGNISYSHYAFLKDRYYEIYEKVSYYGTNYSVTGYKPNMSMDDIRKLPKIYDLPIKDIKNVDKRRAEIGLPPLKTEAKFMNITLPADYQP